MPRKVEAVVAGHICLDIFPGLSGRAGETLIVPGKLVDTGPAEFSTGGAVSNTGLALHRLGVATLLMGKTGADPFGRIILDILRRHAPKLVSAMRVAKDAPTSYSIVISAAGMDRCFLHCSGANNTFCAADLDYTKLSEAKLLHFGYPSLLRKMYCDGGAELAALLRRVKEHGLATSLDMSLPDPASEAGAADWPGLLQKVLPLTDVFLPSIEELLFMADRPRFEELKQKAGLSGIVAAVDGPMLEQLSTRLLDLGVAIAVIKLGDRGLFVRTTGSSARLQALGRCAPKNIGAWRGRKLLAPCFKVDVAGTTGAGDSAIAGFLLGLLRGWPLEEALTMGVAVGACCVEKVDATSGVPACAEVQARLARGWPRHSATLPLPGWEWQAEHGHWRGPGDGA